MLHKAPSSFGKAHLPVREWINPQVIETAVAFAFDQRRSIREGLLHKLHDGCFGFVVRSFWVAGGQPDTLHRVDEEVIRAGGVQQLFGKRPLSRRRLEVVLVLGKVLSHGNQLSANSVPVIEQNPRWAS